MAVYCTSYCNQGHDTKTGRPVGHECYIIPPAALALEIAGRVPEAIEIMEKAGPLKICDARSAAEKAGRTDDREWCEASHRSIFIFEADRAKGRYSCPDCRKVLKLTAAEKKDHGKIKVRRHLTGKTAKLDRQGERRNARKARRSGRKGSHAPLRLE